MHARVRVRVEGDAEAGRKRVRVARAEEARVVEADDEHHAVSHDPLVNGAHGHLFELVAAARGDESEARARRRIRTLRRHGQSRAADGGAQAVSRARADARRRFHALELAGLSRKD